MTPSIRTYLLINLLLSVTLITSLAIIGNLFLAHKDIQAQLDAQLIRTAFRIQSFFSDDISSRDFKKMQQDIDTRMNPLYLEKTDKTSLAEINALKTSEETLTFQIWDRNNKLLLRSRDAPLLPLSSENTFGLTTRFINNKEWRICSIVNKRNQLTIIVAEQSDYRQKLENQLTQDSIFIMLITYPFLGFLIWMIVGRGLDPLKKVASAVSKRAPTYLEPVDLEAVPSEIEPLVAELNSLFYRLQEAFNREKRFTADAAHELKTPLAALSTQIQVALREKTAEGRNQALLKVLAGVNRSTHMVQQLLTLSRMDPEASINEPEPIVLSRITAEIAAQLAPEAITKNVDLELLAPESKATIIGNPTSIAILLRNLIDNAIRYTDENGFVRIDIREDAKTVTLSVTDNGPGIPDELRNRVFERFYRISGTKATGTGLGLGIVALIAKLHQAEVKLSTPSSGKGLEVEIIFPKA